jgi:hypothetical protein
LEDERKELEESLASDLAQIAQEEAIMIESATEAFRSAIYRKNRAIAGFHDAELAKIPRPKVPAEEVDAEMSKRLEAATAELAAIVVPQHPALEETESISEEFARKQIEIENLRKKLSERWESDQKREENRHMKTIAALDLLPRGPDAEFERESAAYRHRLEAKKIQIATLEAELTALRNHSAEIAMTASPEVQIANLEAEFVQIQESSETAIREGQAAFEVQKQAILRSMSSFPVQMEAFAQGAERRELDLQAEMARAADEADLALQGIASEHFESVAALHIQFERDMQVLAQSHSDNVSRLTEEIASMQSSTEKAVVVVLPDLVPSDAGMVEELEGFRTHCQHRIQRLDAKLAALNEKVKAVRSDPNCEGARPEDLDVIARLEMTLAMKTTHLLELAGDMDRYKKQIVAQEGVYNSCLAQLPRLRFFDRRRRPPACGVTRNRSGRKRQPLFCALYQPCATG